MKPTQQKKRVQGLEAQAAHAKERIHQLEAWIQTKEKQTIDKIIPPLTIGSDPETNVEPEPVKVDPNLDDPMNKPTFRLPIVLLQATAAISLGYFCKEFRFIAPENGDMRALEFFVGKIAFPMLIFRTVATANIGAVDFRVVLACTLGKVVVMVATWLFTYFAYGRRSSKIRGVGERLITSTVFGFFTVASNDFGMGFPIILALYGSECSLTVYIAANALVNTVFFQPLAMVLFEVGKSVKSQESHEEGTSSGDNLSIMSVLKRILLNPIMAWTFLGIAYQWGAGMWYSLMHIPRATGLVSLPHPLGDIVDLFTQPFAMLALFQIGTSLETARITFWPGFLVVMKVLMCAYVSFLFSYYLMGPAEGDWAQSALHNFTFFYGMIPASSAPLVFASEYDPTSEGIIATATLLGLALAGPNIFLTALFLSDDAKDRTSTLIDVQIETSHLGAIAAGIFFLLVCGTWKEWCTTWRRAVIAAYGTVCSFYVLVMLHGQSHTEVCLLLVEGNPWIPYKLFISAVQNSTVFFVLYLQWLLSTGNKKPNPLAFVGIFALALLSALATEPFTLNEVCKLHLSYYALMKMAAWRGACVGFVILTTMRGVQKHGAITEPNNEESEDSEPASPAASPSTSPIIASSTPSRYGGCAGNMAALNEACKGDQGTATIKLVVIVQTLRMALQAINCASVVFHKEVMGSFTQMLILESILEHGQITFLVLAILLDKSFKGMIMRLFDSVSKAVGYDHMQSRVSKFFSPTAFRRTE